MIAGKRKTISRFTFFDVLKEGKLLFTLLMVWSLVQIVVLAKSIWIYQIYDEPIYWNTALWNRFISWITGFIFITLIVFATRRLMTKKLNWWKIGLIHLATASVVAIGMYAASYLILHSFAIEPKHLIFNFAVEIDRLFLIYILVSSVTYAYHYMDELLEQKRRESILNEALSELKLSNIDHILGPHILHNTLNSISALIDKNRVEAQNMISDLSEYLRSTFGQNKPLMHSVNEELEVLKQFISIQKKRFNNAIHVEFHIPPEIGHQLIPRMILQPIVENAICHGWKESQKELRITIYIQEDYPKLIITVSNDGLPIHTMSFQMGEGCSNVVSRLELAYEKNYEFLLHNTDNGVECKMQIPVIT